MAFTAQESVRRHEIPNVAEIIEGNGGLPKVQINIPACTGEIYLHGAHVTSWKPAGEEEVFFVSARSRFENGRAIRGGVPVCFPWFAHKDDAPPDFPDHGFVRTKDWQLDSITQAGGAVTVSMSTQSDESTKKWWPADFRAVLRATFAKQLSLEFEVTNTGAAPLSYEEALHAYFHVGNIEMSRARIPDALRFIDKTDRHQIKPQFGDIQLRGETDSVYLNTVDEIELEDEMSQRRVRVGKEHSRTTVVWNPWKQKAQSMSDLGTDEWQRMMCIEPSNVADFAVHLAPGQQHTLKVSVRVVDF